MKTTSDMLSYPMDLTPWEKILIGKFREALAHCRPGDPAVGRSFSHPTMADSEDQICISVAVSLGSVKSSMSEVEARVERARLSGK